MTKPALNARVSSEKSGAVSSVGILTYAVQRADSLSGDQQQRLAIQKRLNALSQFLGGLPASTLKHIYRLGPSTELDPENETGG